MAPPVTTWPTVRASTLDPTDSATFEARCEAVRMYLNGCLLKDIHQTTGIQRTEISGLVKKCLRLANDNRVYGFRALIPSVRTNPYKRKSPFKQKLPESRGGLAGALAAVQSRFPKLNEMLISLIRKQAKELRIHEKKLKPKTLHKIFLDFLEEQGLSKSEWPFNTSYRGLRSITKFMRSILDTNFAESVANREEQSAKAHLATGTGNNPILQLFDPYDAVELDAFEIPALLTAAFKTPEGTEVDKEIDRIWLIAMVERASGAVLAYDVVYRSEVSADDVVRVIRRAAGELWEPKALTIPGLKYPDQGGLPSKVIPELRGALWGCLFLDGALAHLADAVRVKARQKLGFFVNYGPVGHFERRPNVERFFAQLAKDVFHRYPSTTGSNPQSGRAQDAAEQAVRLKIRASDAEQVIDVKIAQYNSTESEGISYLSPLQYLRYYVEEKKDHFVVRHINAEPGAISIIPGTKECAVKGGSKSGRRPYINLDRVRYTSPILASAGALIGTTLTIEFDEEDFRQVRAFLPSGAELGYLRAHGKWGVTKHSRKTRKIINSLVTKRILTVTEHDDPVEVYLKSLSASSQKQNRAKNEPSKPQAKEAARVARESGLELTLAPKKPETKNTEQRHVLDQPRHSSIRKQSADIYKLLSGRRKVG